MKKSDLLNNDYDYNYNTRYSSKYNTRQSDKSRKLVLGKDYQDTYTTKLTRKYLTRYGKGYISEYGNYVILKNKQLPKPIPKRRVPEIQWNKTFSENFTTGGNNCMRIFGLDPLGNLGRSIYEEDYIESFPRELKPRKTNNELKLKNLTHTLRLENLIRKLIRVKYKLKRKEINKIKRVTSLRTIRKRVRRIKIKTNRHKYNYIKLARYKNRIQVVKNQDSILFVLLGIVNKKNYVDYLLRNKVVLVNGKLVTNPGYRMYDYDIVTLDIKTIWNQDRKLYNITYNKNLKSFIYIKANIKTDKKKGQL